MCSFPVPCLSSGTYLSVAAYYSKQQLSPFYHTGTPQRRSACSQKGVLASPYSVLCQQETMKQLFKDRASPRILLFGISPCLSVKTTEPVPSQCQALSLWSLIMVFLKADVGVENLPSLQNPTRSWKESPSQEGKKLKRPSKVLLPVIAQLLQDLKSSFKEAFSRCVPTHSDLNSSQNNLNLKSTKMQRAQNNKHCCSVLPHVLAIQWNKKGCLRIIS